MKFNGRVYVKVFIDMYEKKITCQLIKECNKFTFGRLKF